MLSVMVSATRCLHSFSMMVSVVRGLVVAKTVQCLCDLSDGVCTRPRWCWTDGRSLPLSMRVIQDSLTR